MAGTNREDGREMTMDPPHPPVPRPLVDLGLHGALAQAWDDQGRPEPLGRAVRLDRGWCTLLVAPEAERPPLRARTFGQVAVGDWVILDEVAENVEKVIQANPGLF